MLKDVFLFFRRVFQAEHNKVYIPQRLEEIEREQAVLKGRMSAFNTKIKDKDIEGL